MIHVYGGLKRHISLSLLRNISFSRYNCENHYEVLQLSRNCTQQEIKNAFIQLSKKYHPDKNVDDSTHNKFVKLNEAYTVLSRHETRKDYDLSLVSNNSVVLRSRKIRYDTDFTTEEPKPFHDNSFWENRDRNKDAENAAKPYYGIKGIKKVSNTWILSLLFLFVIFGVGLQVLLIRKSIAFSRKVLDEESSRNADIYKQVRARAMAQESDSAVLERLEQNSDAHKAANTHFRSTQD